MPRKSKFMRMQDVDFKSKLLDFHIEYGEILAEQIKNEAKKLLRPVIAGHKSAVGFKNAIIRVKSEITPVRGKGVRFTLILKVIDIKTSRLHEVFHHVNDGRRSYKVKKTTIFNPRSSNRTSPGSLDVGKWDGKYGTKFESQGSTYMLNDKVVLHPGRTLKGFEGRNFYLAVAEKLELSLNYDKWLDFFTEIEIKIRETKTGKRKTSMNYRR